MSMPVPFTVIVSSLSLYVYPSSLATAYVCLNSSPVFLSTVNTCIRLLMPDFDTLLMLNISLVDGLM